MKELFMQRLLSAVKLVLAAAPRDTSLEAQATQPSVNVISAPLTKLTDLEQKASELTVSDPVN